MCERFRNSETMYKFLFILCDLLYSILCLCNYTEDGQKPLGRNVCNINVYQLNDLLARTTCIGLFSSFC